MTQRQGKEKQILEIIYSVDGAEEMYDCELLGIDEEKVIVEHAREQESDFRPVILRRG